MNRQAIIGDALQMFRELPFEDQVLMRYGYVSSEEMAEDLEYELHDADVIDVTECMEYMNFLKKKGKNG